MYLIDREAEMRARRDLALEWIGALYLPIKRLHSFADAAMRVT